MGPTSKRATTSSVRYTFSDEDEQQSKVERAQRNEWKKKKANKHKTAVCKICNKSYTNQEGLLSHMKLHTDTLDFACDVCDARFKTSKYLAMHRKRVHSPATHECDFCGKLFTLPSKLEQHRLVHTGEKPHKCEVCGKAFRAPYSLNTHRYLHTNEKPYKCQYCPYACRDNSTLRKHHERHTGTLKWHHCSYCDKKFYAKSLLKNHVSERHFAVDLKVIPCPQCSNKFKTNGMLNRHIKLVHEKVLRTKCEVCGVEITNRNNMASHLRSHIDVRPYKCEVKTCKSKFKDMSALRKHSLIHKPSEQFSCEVCGRLFARRHRLNLHLRQHGDDTKLNTRFKIMFCDYCGFSYDNKPRLVRHMLKHIRHRNTYVCDICKYVTHRKLSIEKHMKYGHGDEDDVHCKICNKSYKLHAYLIVHYYNRHGIRYKTVKSIKLETSVTIKEEPQEPIADVEVDLEEIQKQEPLADIITDVALDCDATDITYSKSVLIEDIQRSTTGSQFATSPDRFRRRLKGRSALLDEQNTLYARKEKDVRKRIKRLLTRVRHRKWTRVLERARQQYNNRIRAMTNKGKNKENNLKIKYVNVNQVNNNKMDKKEFNNDETTENVNSSNTSDKKINIDSYTGDDEEDINNVEMKKPFVNDNNLERICDELENDRNIDETTSLMNDDEVDRDGDVANIYEDVLDIEENPIGNDVNSEEKDTSSDVGEGCYTAVNDNLNKINTNSCREENSEAIVNKIPTILEISTIENVEVNIDENGVGISNEENNTNVDYNEINENVSNETVNCESDEQCTRNIIEEDITVNNNECGSNVNDNKEEFNEGNKGKSLKLKINTHQCYICYKLYETKEKLLEHCQMHFDVCSDIPLKKCPLCKYVTKLNITRHIKLVHGINLTLPYKLNDKKKNSEDASRYVYDINDKVVKEIEIIPSVRNLNKIAYVKIDKNNRNNKDLSVAKTKLVKKSGEWIVEHENMNVNNEFILPKFDKKEIKRLTYVGDQYLDVIKALGRLASRHKAKMLYPCNGCDKLCTTFAALKLHSRRHEANPKPFRKKVWKHKLKGVEKKPVKTSNNRIKEATERVRQAKPKPIENKHKCDKTLMDFYEKNIKGADIEFWQFLKIYNRMNKDHAENMKDFKETNEFGDYTTEENRVNEITDNDPTTEPSKSTNSGISNYRSESLRDKNSGISNNKPNIRNKFTRKLILSKEERLRRAQIKEELRKKIISNQ